MDFFKTVFSNEPDPSSSSDPKKPSHSNPNSSTHPSSDLPQNPNTVWFFGDLVKTLATRSESVIEIYRRDLDEFRSGLKKETEAIVDVASRAVRDLPSSLDGAAAAAAAQASLELVGNAIDDFGASVWRGTAEIILHGEESLLDLDDGSPDWNPASPSNSNRYRRLDAQIVGIQSDPGTFCYEPEDSEGFKRWKLGFSLEDEGEEVEDLCGENGALEGMYLKLVPSVVDRETFWSRYFYRVYKLKVAEDARANLVKRAISREDDEELSWEVEDKDEEATTHVLKNGDLGEKIAQVSEKSTIENNYNYSSHEGGESGGLDLIKEPISVDGFNEKLQLVEKQCVIVSNSDESVAQSDEKMTGGRKIAVGEPGKDGGSEFMSYQRSAHEEEDLGWDEIEGLSSIDEKKVVATGASPSKEYLLKRLSAADEEEDLSWDIEDDEPVKH